MASPQPWIRAARESRCPIPDPELLSPVILFACLYHSPCHITQHWDGLLEYCLPHWFWVYQNRPSFVLFASATTPGAVLALQTFPWDHMNQRDRWLPRRINNSDDLVQVQAQPLASCEALSKELHTTGPQFPHLHHEEVYSQSYQPTVRQIPQVECKGTLLNFISFQRIQIYFSAYKNVTSSLRPWKWDAFFLKSSF